MHNDTRVLYNEYLARQAQLNGVSSASQGYSVTPTVQQILEDKIQESSEFLGKINMVPVREKSGAKLGLGINGPGAGRTNTEVRDRQPRDLHTLDSTGYSCEQTEFDTYIRYATLDAWAKFKDFQTRVRNQIIQRQALDRMVIGFHGVSVSPDSDLLANPMLQDVNKGWLQHLRTDAPSRVMQEVKPGSGAVKIGAGVGIADGYKNIDALVFDAIRLMDPWYHNNPRVVCMLGRTLLDDKYFPLINTQQTPSETLAADIVVSQKRVGGLQAVALPYFPDNTLLITTYDNLSIYWQESARRRRTEENAKRSRIENYDSSNDAYVVENYGLAAMVENIQFVG
ncbi:phage major capsid protein, P2 family [Acidovorax sp. SUPP1855]|uniref:phage major capsid protein, P2 family n=1 Tax=Acidovorax sp. SUPP1855 TaxID=431774 RepID=UPI0023DE6296|nr:phage major capsid protein, P2 family [Acidovorax sp. SUPP1855]GKS83203.1 phage major capsid protein, P2 family [Acidovorax sp. SUPP1855]